MTETIKAYLDYLEFEKRFSSHTVTAYRTDLAQFEVFLTAEGILPESVTRQTLREWLASLSGQKMSSVSINRKLAALKGFYRFLFKKKFIQSDPSVAMVSLKKPGRIPGFVDEQAMELMLDPARFTNDLSGKRDQLILEMLYGTGIRLSELIGLKTGEVNLTARTIRVFGKRAKQRIVPITVGLANLLYGYLEAAGSPDAETFLFRTDKGRPLYPVFVQRLVGKHLAAVSTLATKSPHVLRHTYATHLLNRGADLNAIKELLGHSSLASTQIYTHNAIEELKKAFLQAHPKA